MFENYIVCSASLEGGADADGIVEERGYGRVR